MPPTDREFHAALSRVTTFLSRDLGGPALTVRIGEGAEGTRLAGGVLTVPESVRRHWQRFGNLPTAFLRDAAYALKRSRGADEADSATYAEAFVRHVLEAPDD